MKNLTKEEINKGTPMEIQYKQFNFDVQETKQIEDDNGIKTGIIRGFLATYGNIDRVNDRIEPGAFKESIERHKSEGRPIRMLFQHDRKQVIGGFPIEKVRDDIEGLFVEGEIVLESDKTRQIFALAKKGFLSDMSIGFSIDESEFDENGVRILKKLDLWEGSIVDEPANPDARIQEVKLFTTDDAESIKTKRDFEKFLRDVGMSRKGAVILASRFNEQREADSQDEQKAQEAEALTKKAIEDLRQAIARI